MRARPLLSVVVPFYGVQDYIGDCLNSIAAQTYQDIDVVMVDDGSPDGSRAVAEEWAARDSRFRIITQDNAGLGPARNTGVRHTDGVYLTFVDSDDLVTRHGFDRMVSALETTGSSFAGGNARRFNNSGGVKPSWAHQLPFQRTRYVTHVLEQPVLARDRMVWNKVYRRSFWDEFGYEFPAIRYEDYPVTLRAHLEASTVDMLAEPVYYWRERESGDSITQQVFRYDNLLDRVTSAGMVIDLVAGAPADVRLRTHVMLAETDFVAIVQAFADVPESEVDRFLDLGHDFVGRLSFDALEKRTRYDRLQYHAMMHRDVELLRELAVFRREGGLRGGARAVKVRPRSRRYEYRYPGHDRRYLPRDVFLTPTTDMNLRTAVNHIAWTDAGLVVRGTAEVRHIRSGPDSTITVRAVSTKVRELLPLKRFDDIDSHGQLSAVGFEFVIPRDKLRAWGDEDAPVRFDIQIASKGIRRNGLLRGLRAGSATWQPGSFLGDDWWAQPSPFRDGSLSVRFVERPWELRSATVEGTDLVITARLPRPLQVARVVLSGSRWAEPLNFPAECEIRGRHTVLTARLSLREIQENTADDDPFLQTSHRTVRVKAAGELHSLLWTGDPQTVAAKIDDHQFRLTRTQGNFTVLTESAVRLTADAVELVGTEGTDGAPGAATIIVRGRDWTGTADWRIAWRRYLPGTEDFVESSATTVAEDGTWQLRVPAADLLSPGERTSDIDPLASIVDWALFATSDSRDLSTSVIPEPFLVAAAPWVVIEGERRGTIAPRAETLHVDVREKSPSSTPRVS
ncbi:glycosyltransferase [Calidifontibacter sp. DB0510]|uniref:Glycosyltransferase n=1 Tax=Metallococcus carri TaxID=1656884 RepID=A0A967EDC9_9MICO|nr:glycosyltransferase family 2 protein [Metallococcus carri]NHN54601.1 glycosyltransferase [Metallococcus carri]NOP36560.1 glycosyltransferase [Calidifontibacter sp. DB2511S]